MRQGIPEFLMQQHVLPFPLSSGSVCPTPSGTVSFLSLEACYLLLLNFDILKRGCDLNLSAGLYFITHSCMHVAIQQAFIEHPMWTRL